MGASKASVLYIYRDYINGNFWNYFVLNLFILIMPLKLKSWFCHGATMNVNCEVCFLNVPVYLGIFLCSLLILFFQFHFAKLAMSSSMDLSPQTNSNEILINESITTTLSTLLARLPQVKDSVSQSSSSNNTTAMMSNHTHTRVRV